MLKFVIYGHPIPKARHRTKTYRFGKKRYAFKNRLPMINYDPQSELKKHVTNVLRNKLDQMKQDNDQQIANEASNLLNNELFYVEMEFYFPIPESCANGQKNLILWGIVEHNKKPDVSNLIKFYEDAANEVLFPDDRMIVRIKGQKFFSEIPRTEINVMPKKNEHDTKSSEIWEIYGPDQITNLVNTCGEIYNEYLRLENNENDTVLMSKIAKFLSQLADDHADLLKNVKKKAEGYWKNPSISNLNPEHVTIK